MTKDKLIVVINGELIELPHNHRQKVGDAIAQAFKRSSQKVGENGRWRIEDRFQEPLTPDSSVEWLSMIFVTLMPGPNDGGEVVTRDPDPPLLIPAG